MTQPSPPVTQQSRPDASMTLLTQLLASPLDPGYAAAARTRRAAGLPPATSTRSAVLVLAAAVIGLLLVAASAALRPPATAATAAREQLVREIGAGRAEGDRLAARTSALRTSIDRAEAAALPGAGGAAVLARARALEAPTGAAAVTGPGLRVTLDDARQAQPAAGSGGGVNGSGGGGADSGSGSSGGGAPGAGTGPRDAGSGTPGRVLGSDLQVVVNGLWAAGAEAVSVNGERLSARSAIRFAGEAILVDYRPLTRPYVVLAVGEPAAMQAGFAAGDAGAYVHALGLNYGIQSSVAQAGSLRLPAAAALAVHAARPGSVPGPGGGASAPLGGSP